MRVLDCIVLLQGCICDNGLIATINVLNTVPAFAKQGLLPSTPVHKHLIQLFCIGPQKVLQPACPL